MGYNDDILSMAFMGPSNNHLAVATNSSQIKVFEFPNFSCQLLKDHLDIVLTVDVFSKHRNILVSGSKVRVLFSYTIFCFIIASFLTLLLLFIYYYHCINTNDIRKCFYMQG